MVLLLLLNAPKKGPQKWVTRRDVVFFFVHEEGVDYKNDDL